MQIPFFSLKGMMPWHYFCPVQGPTGNNFIIEKQVKLEWYSLFNIRYWFSIREIRV